MTVFTHSLGPLPTDNLGDLARLAQTIRLRALRMVSKAGSSHIGTVFSMAELLAILYGSVLRLDPEVPSWGGRDRFILSKGHGAAGLYVALALRGFFPTGRLETFCQNGSQLAGHVSHLGIPGVELSTGSLGHGLSVGCGMALAGSRAALGFRVFVLLSDGECDEGSTWEPALLAPHHGLDNLTVVIDYNKIQSLGRTDEVMRLDPLAAKWESFGWATKEVDGHDLGSLLPILESAPFETGKPSCLIARTIKGKGVSFMEDKLLWHYRCPRGDELAAAVAELSGI